jgi:predicted nucleotidyltransferase component of viral defense system
LNHARANGLRFNEVLQRYALERWLFRLSEGPHADRFVLKGALMLTAWGLPVSRPTKDIDMLARVPNDPDTIRQMVVEVCGTAVENDGLAFEVASVTTERISEDALYEGVRAKFKGRLGNARVAMQVDLGFSDVITPGPVDFTYPTLLDQPAPKLKGYNPETTVAEKFEAMVKLGELNSRMKDFFDVWALVRSQSLAAPRLAEAIAKTFSRRGTPLTADAACFSESFGQSSEKQTQWAAFLRRSRLADCVPEAFADVWREVMAFLRPMTNEGNS